MANSINNINKAIVRHSTSLLTNGRSGFLCLACCHSFHTSSTFGGVSAYNKKKADKILVYFTHDMVLNSNNFIAKVKDRTVPGQAYVAYIMFSFPGQIFKMAGNQFAFIYEDGDLTNISLLCRKVNLLLANTMELYGYVSLPDNILLTFSSYSGKVKPISLRNLGVYQPREASVRLSEFDKPLPLTTDAGRYGDKLKPVFDGSGLISHFTVVDKAVHSSVFEGFGPLFKSVNKDSRGAANSLVFEPTDSYYLLNSDTLVHVVVDGKASTKHVIDVDGTLITTIVDVVNDDKSFTRTRGNVLLDVKDNKVGVYRVKSKLNPIVSKAKKAKYLDNRYGTLDLETYTTPSNTVEVYACGFCVNNVVSMFYINKDLNATELVLRLIDAMLVEKYHKHHFYAHNLSGYDAPFILKVLVDHNESVGREVYKLDTLFRDARVISLTISKKVKNSRNISRVYKITLKDSLLLLNSSLDKLGKAYQVDVVKGVFPHKFASDKTLFYKGEMPGIDNYNLDNYNLDNNETDNLDNKQKYNLLRTEFERLGSKVWDFESQCREYLRRDLESLYLILHKFSKEVFTLYGVDIRDTLTISRLAFNIFDKNHYKNNIGLIVNKEMWNCCKQAFYGGPSEVFIPFGENLVVYDINSLYPWGALMPMPGVEVEYVDFRHGSGNLVDLFGIYFVEVETDNNYLGLLPYRSEDGSVKLANGRWSGWYFSEELKLAHENGYRIRVKRGYTFSKVYGMFTPFVLKMFKVKAESRNPIHRQIAKSILNNTYGRFGMDIDKPITALVDRETLEQLEKSRRILGKVSITDNCILVTFERNVSKEVCEEFGADYIESLEAKYGIKSLSKGGKFSDVNIAVAAAVTSYGRIAMARFKLDLIKKGYKIYYSDTDSLVLNKPLDPSLVGEGLGQFKLEHVVKRGYFISSKLYLLVTDKNVVIRGGDILQDSNTLVKDVKDRKDKKDIYAVKGGDSKGLTERDFINLLVGYPVKGKRKTHKSDYAAGSTKLEDVDIEYDPNSYKNRAKILDKSGIWIDTAPHYVGELAVGVYNPNALALISLEDDEDVTINKSNKNTSKYEEFRNKPANNKVIDFNSKTFRRSYATFRELDILGDKKDNTLKIKEVSRKILSRAEGNFIKGVIYGQFEGVDFEDYTLLIDFLYGFDKDIKVSPQSLSNVKYRRLPFKPLHMNRDVDAFVCYIQERFPEFKGEWLFENPPNIMYDILDVGELLALYTLEDDIIEVKKSPINIEGDNKGVDKPSLDIEMDNKVVGKSPLNKEPEYKLLFYLKPRSLFIELYGVYVYYMLIYGNRNFIIYYYLYLVLLLVTNNITLFTFNLFISDIWVADLGPDYSHIDSVNIEPEVKYINDPDLLALTALPEVAESPIADPKLQAKSFIRTHFAMLDFNNLTYYPSKFQASTMPIVIDKGLVDPAYYNHTILPIHVNSPIDSAGPAGSLAVITPSVTTIEVAGPVESQYPLPLSRTNSTISVPSVASIESVGPVYNQPAEVATEAELLEIAEQRIRELEAELRDKSVKWYDQTSKFKRIEAKLRLDTNTSFINDLETWITHNLNVITNYDAFVANTKVSVDYTTPSDNKMVTFNLISAKITDLIGTLDLLEGQIKDTADVISNNKLVIQTLEAELATTKDSLETVNKVLGYTIDNLSTTKKELAHVEVILKETNTELDERYEAIDYLEKKIKTQETQIADLERDNQKLSYEIYSNMEELKHKKDEIVDYMDNVKELKASLAEANAKAKEYIGWYDDTLDQVKEYKIQIALYEPVYEQLLNLTNEYNNEKRRSDSYIEWYDESQLRINELEAKLKLATDKLYIANETIKKYSKDNE